MELGKDVVFKQIFNLTSIFLNSHHLMLFHSPILNFPFTILVTSAVADKQYYHILVMSDILSGKVKPSVSFEVLMCYLLLDCCFRFLLPPNYCLPTL